MSCYHTGQKQCCQREEASPKTYVLVAGSNNGDNAGVGDGGDGVVHGRGERASQGHVHNSLAGELLGLNVVDDELHAVQDARVATGTAGIEDLDGNELDVLGNAKGSAANGTGNVAAVAVFIGVLGIIVRSLFFFSFNIREGLPPLTLLLTKLAPNVARPWNSMWVVRMPVSTT